MNRVGSTSEGSQESHASGPATVAAHDASVAVLPYPAGAETRATR